MGKEDKTFSGRTKMLGGTEMIEKYAHAREFKSESDFARFLHGLEPKRSVNAWRNAIMRWKRAGGEIEYTNFQSSKMSATQPNFVTQVPDGIKDEYAIDAPEAMRSYYDDEKDIYFTFIPQANAIIKVEGDKHRDMKKRYSDEGGRFTVAEMASTFHFPILWMQDYIKAHNWRHPMSPYTDEQMMSMSEDEMVVDFLELKRQSALARSQRAHYNAMAKAAHKWRNLDEAFYGDFKEALGKGHLPRKKVPKIKMGDVDPYAVVMSPTDLHFGSSCWIDETGNHYDTEEAKSRLINRTHNLISRLPGRPERIFLATGSDWFHIDNEQGHTTSGTPQDMSTSPTQIFMDGCELAREHIELLRGVCPVEVLFMRGNHDRHLAIALMMYLKAIYEEVEDVSIVVDPKLRQYVSWGNTLMGFTHGDGVKGMDLPSLMAKEEWQQWGSCENKIWFHGHLHHQSVIEKGGAMVVQLPSLAGDDRWHYRKGYVLSRPGLCAHMIDEKLGLIGNLFAPVVEDE